MADWVIVTAITVVYLTGVLVIGIRAGNERTRTSLEGYLADSRSMGFLVLFFIMGAEIFSAFAFLGAPGWSYSRGAPGLYLLGTFALALLPWWSIGPRTARLGARYGFLTQAELLGARFDSRLLSALVALVGVVVMMPYLTVQIVGAGFLFEASTEGHVPFWLGGLLAFVVVAVYVFTSGLRGIGWTNVLQGILMLIVAWAVGLAIPERFHGGVGAMFERLAAEAPEYLTIPGHDQALSWGGYTSAILVTFLGLSMWPHLFAKSYGAASEDSIKRTIVVYPLYGLLLVPVLFVGFAGVLVVPELEDPDRILLELVAMADFSPWFVGILLSGALAAAMSTGANLAHTSASILVKDVWVRLLRPETSERTQIRMTRGLVLGVCVAAYILALDPPESIVAMVLLAFAGLIQLMPLAIVTFYWRRATPAGALAGLIGGTGVAVYFTYFAPLPWDIHAGLWGLLVNILLLVGVSLSSPPMDADHVERFVDAARIPLSSQTRHDLAGRG